MLPEECKLFLIKISHAVSLCMTRMTYFLSLLKTVTWLTPNSFPVKRKLLFS